MEPLSPVYLSAIAAQTGGLSAFLGGFAATFLGTLLALNVRGRTGSLAIGFAVTSSVAFIVAVVGSTATVAALHPDGPAARVASAGFAQVVMSIGFVLGLYALLLSLGLSGWSRSKGTGWTTSIAAALGVILVTGMVVSIG
jgi:hypothetical protein